MSTKAIISAVSVILVVGVAIGVVVGVHKSSDSSVSSEMKAVKSMCSPTSYQDLCVETLTKATNDTTTSDPKELVMASISTVIDHVQIGINMSASFFASYNNSEVPWTLQNCKTLYEDAMDNLQEILSVLKDSDLQKVTEDAPGLQDYLNMVIADAVTCSDEIDDFSGKRSIQSHAGNVTMVTDNALAILGELSQILLAFGIKLNATAFQAEGNRKLLAEEAAVAAIEGFPSWFSNADRRLLGMPTKGDKDANFTIAPVVAGATPHAVVAKDGSGKFKTLAEALDAYPAGHQGRYIVHVKAGVYKEWYTLTKEKINVFVYGDGPTKTIITNNISVPKNKVSTSKSATLAVEAAGFIAKDIAFENTAGPDAGQAVALRVKAQRCAFFNIRTDGFQDTLYVHGGLQFYRDCVITGTVDYIFGDSSTIIQNSRLIVRKGRLMNAVTAMGKVEKHETTAIVLQNCTVEAEAAWDKLAVKSFLGRPWKNYATTIFMESDIGDFINPEGYMPMAPGAESTCYYGEYRNRGAGADTKQRVRWPGFHVMQPVDAERYTVEKYLHKFAQPVPWVKSTGFPYIPGLAAAAA
ncbi:hypothetical protein SAY86_025311 [Trapa natans]|uniref:Pectinesterase n=1 Tax=Trapa natans TaxID=22666 RepID=A0AAN7M7X7_TRANT|nr:hypothetical protein SAY86_025311 [Trapa natans]